MFCLLILTCILGCYGTEVVRIKVGVDSEVDMEKYETIAVMDFIDTRSNSLTNEGRTLARMIRRQLGKSKEFQILDERSMYMMLEEEIDIDKGKIEDSKVLMSICEQLGVSALIVGTFDFYQMTQPIPYIVERYSPSTGRYSPETRTYVQRLYRFSFNAKVVDGATGEAIFNYTPEDEERPEFRRSWGMPFSGDRTDPTSLRGLAARPVTVFVLSLIPHYEYERRILVR